MSRRVPSAIKILEGNPGKRPIAKGVKAPAEMPQMPEYLDAYAREEWERVAPALFAMGVLRSVDQMTFAAYCEACSIWRSCVEQLNIQREVAGDEIAFVMPSMKGKSDENPLIRTMRKQAELILRYSAVFGLTPIDRDRLSASAEPDDEFGGLIGGGAIKN